MRSECAGPSFPSCQVRVVLYAVLYAVLCDCAVSNTLCNCVVSKMLHDCVDPLCVAVLCDYSVSFVLL
jgi:hypothetical protein